MRQIKRVDGKLGRYYDVEGLGQLPSVTTILQVIAKPGLIPWAKNEALKLVEVELKKFSGKSLDITDEFIDTIIVRSKNRPKEILDEASDFGTQAHILIDKIIRNEPVEIPDVFKPVVDGFLAWKSGEGFEILSSEVMVYSEKHGYAGSLDCLAKRNGSLSVLDWKSSKGIYDTMALQVAAYAKAHEEINGTSISEAWIIRFPKMQPQEGEVLFEPKKVQNLDKRFAEFLAAKKIFDGLKEPKFSSPED